MYAIRVYFWGRGRVLGPANGASSASAFYFALIAYASCLIPCPCPYIGWKGERR